MTNKNAMTGAISLLGTIGVLALAYGFDYRIGSLKLASGQNLKFVLELLRTYPVTELVMAVSLLTLFWYVNQYAPQGILVTLIVTLVGLGTLFYVYEDAFFHVLPHVRFLDFAGTVAWSSAFVAVIGLWGLIRSLAGMRRHTSTSASV